MVRLSWPGGAVLLGSTGVMGCLCLQLTVQHTRHWVRSCRLSAWVSEGSVPCPRQGGLCTPAQQGEKESVEALEATQTSNV